MKNEKKKIQVRQYTTYEKQRWEEKKRLNKENFIKDQIVQGKVYKGKGFEASEKLEFLDFEVGKIYEKNIQLVNISWSFNSFKILPIDKIFQNNFEIEYCPPGRVSAGISTPLKIIFFPQSRINIDTILPLMCETGKIEIPIKCRYKTTNVILSKNCLDFGTTIIGDEKVLEIFIENQGGLQTKFEIQNYKGQKISKSNITMSAISSQSEVSDENSLEQDYSNREFEVDYDFFNQNLKIEYKKKLSGYSKKKIILTYKPHKIQEFKTVLLLKFANFMDQKDLKLEIFGKSQNPYISSKQDLYDLKICLLGQIYRQKIVFINKSKQTSNIKIIQPEESFEFFQFNPQLSFIQPLSQANVWLKITTKEKIFEYLEDYIVDNVLTLPIKVECSEQRKKINFQIKLELSSQQIVCKNKFDFGKIYENTSSIQRINFTNKSLLPCKILYQNLPKNISILNVPNPFDLNPRQSIDIVLQYKATKIGQDKGKIFIKYIIGSQSTGEMVQKFQVIVKKNPLKISALRLEFPVCQPKEIHNHFVLIQNISRENYIVEFQPPPFNFSGIQIDVKVAKIENSKTKKFPISFQSSFVDNNLSKEKINSLMSSNNLAQKRKRLEQLNELNQELQEQKIQNKNKKDILKEIEVKENHYLAEIKMIEEHIEEEVENWQQNFDFEKYIQKLGGEIKNVVIDNVDVQFKRWLIPVQFKKQHEPDTLINIIYLEIETLVRKPVLQLTNNVLDFGVLPLGFGKVMNFEIENKTDFEQNLKMDLLGYNSGFNVLNILQTIKGHEKQQYSIRFQPEEVKKYNENLRIFDKFATNLQLIGEAVYPEIELENEVNFLDLGAVLCGQNIIKNFKILNKQKFDMLYNIKILQIGQSLKGVQNVFSISPIQQIINKESGIEIQVKFEPKIPGINYYIKFLIEVQEMQKQIYFYVRAQSYNNLGYVLQWNPDVQNYIEQQIELKQKSEKQGQFQNFNSSCIEVFLELQKDQKEIIRQFQIGNVQNSIISFVEFEIKPENSEFSKLFQFNLQKGKLNTGETQILEIKYNNTDKNKQNYTCIKNLQQIKSYKVEIIFKGDCDLQGNKIDQRIVIINLNFCIDDIIN